MGEINLAEQGNETVVIKINGQDQTMTLAEAVRLAQSAGGWEKKVQELKPLADYGQRMNEALNNDPEAVKKAIEEKYNLKPTSDPRSTKGGYGDDDQEDEFVGSEVGTLKATLKELAAEIAAIKQGVGQSQAELKVQRDLEALRRSDPDLTDEGLARILVRATESGVSDFKILHEADKASALATRVAELEAAQATRDKQIRALGGNPDSLGTIQSLFGGVDALPGFSGSTDSLDSIIGTVMMGAPDEA
jgi:hypothetical protein